MFEDDHRPRLPRFAVEAHFSVEENLVLTPEVAGGVGVGAGSQDHLVAGPGGLARREARGVEERTGVGLFRTGGRTGPAGGGEAGRRGGAGDAREREERCERERQHQRPQYGWPRQPGLSAMRFDRLVTQATNAGFDFRGNFPVGRRD